MTSPPETSAPAHWDTVYATKPADTVSWFQPASTISLRLIAETGAGPGASVIDVGGGASTLVDGLLERGFSRLSVLDVSEQALALTRARLGRAGDGVSWLVEDASAWTPAAGRYDLWHDRAVFHFMTTEAARDGYLRALNLGLKPGGQLIIATFALAGPERCSGLPVQRYAPETLQAVLGERYDLLEAFEETHLTPAQARQAFLWCRFRRRA